MRSEIFTQGMIRLIIIVIVTANGLISYSQTPDINNSTWNGWTDRGSSTASGVWARGGMAQDYQIYSTVFVYSNSNPIPGTSTGFSPGSRILAIGIRNNSGATGSPTIKFDPNNNSFSPSPDGIVNGQASFSGSGDLGDAVLNSSAGNPTEITIRSANPYTAANDYYLPNGGNWGGPGQPGFRGINPATGVWKVFFDLDQMTAEFGPGGSRNILGKPTLGAFGSTIAIAIGGLGGTEAVVQNISTAVPVLPVRVYTDNAETILLSSHATIQAGITAAAPGNYIRVDAGTYTEALLINKALTIRGTEATCILDGTGLGNGSGITITNGTTDVSISGLTIRNHAGAGPNSFAGIYAVGGNNNLTVSNCTIRDNLGGSGFYANGPVDVVTLNNLEVFGHTNVAGAARGIVIWNGLKSNITITNCDVYNNNCCGIELQDGTATGVTMSNNNVYNNGDNGIGIVGMQGPGANLISGNTLSNNGRFGMEIKNPNGNGALSGPGSIVVSGNSVTRSVAIGDLRDIAGIAVMRRGVLAGNVDVPTGVVVSGNTVSGYVQPSTSEGFGIVIGGTNHKVTGNTVTGNDVGIQQQAGHTPYPGDGDQGNLADQYFGRDNSPMTCANTIGPNTLSGNGLDERNIGVGAGIVTNTNTTEIFCSIQSAINDVQTLNGHTLTVQPGTYNEQVIVNKELTIKSATATKAIINFTGTPTGKPTLFDVTANNVTIENLQFDVDLSKLSSAIIASSLGLDNITVKDNLINAYGTPPPDVSPNIRYAERNAVSVNYSGRINYRVATGGVNSVSFTGNTVNGTGPTSYFRSGISLDEGGLTATGNTLTTINHDVLLRFASNGANNISNNNFNGGGVELADQNAGSGTITVSNNTFTGAGAPGTAKLRIKNGEFNVAHVISTNSFNTFDWGVSLENMRNITLNGNTFTGDAATDRHIVVNTKSISSNSNTILQFPVDAVITNNSFAGQGIALTFQNHDSDNDSYGTFTIGSAGNANTFAAGLSTFIQLDAQTGISDGSTFPTYPNTGGWPTTMDCWATNLDIQNNTFDVGAGQQAPQAMSAAQRTTLESKLTHKPDVACLGNLQYFLPVKNVTQNTFYSTIQSAINAAAINNVIELSEWTFNEAVTIDKSLTLQGVNPDKSKQVINGTGLGVISGITINNGVTGVTIQNLTVQNFTGTNGNSHAGIYGIGGNNNLTVTNVAMLNNPTASGFYANGPVDNVTITNSMAVNNGGNARGIVIWNGLKTNITITGNMVTNNSCCGIELQDGNASGVNISNNTIDIGGGDNAIGVVGLNTSVGANTINSNIITGGGRYGIEIKNPAGGVTVNGNSVTLSTQNGDARDRAGIAILRRGVLAGNVDVPNGVTITGNTVTGYQQSSTSEGFGIVVEGTNHTVTGNTVTGCEVGILQQQNPSGYPSDADQSNVGDLFFGRGNSPMTCGNTIGPNTLSGNGTDTRNIGVGAGIVTNTNTSEIFCSIQAAINDAQTLDGHTLNVSAGTFNENVTLTKDLTINGASPATTILTPTVACSGTGITISANNATVQNLKVTNFSNGLAVTSAGVLINNVESVSNCNTGLELSSGTTNLSVQNSKLNNNTSTGFRKGTAAIVSGFTLNNSEVKGNVQGCFVAKNNGVGGTFDNVTITNSDFSNNTQKGMYFEALSNAMIDGVTINASGIDPGYDNNAGIDINLKYGAYTNITIQNSDITNSGVYGTATDVEQTAAVMIKARDDSPSYNTVPASLSSVLIKNNKITGPQNGIRFGEFGKINAGPSNVTVEGNNLSHAFANKAVIRRTNNSINLVCNWHGTTSLPTIWGTFSQVGSGSINLNSVLGVGTDPNPAVGFQPSGSCTCPSGNLVTNTNTTETFCTIQAAIDDADTQNSHVLVAGPGTYVENVVVNKELELRGANYNVNPNTGVRGPESILMTAIIEVAGTNNSRIVAVDANNVKINGFLLDGNNPALTSGFTNNVGADMDIRNGIDNAKGIQNLRVENNIIKNMVYYGVRIQSTTGLSPAVSSGHEIHNNRFMDMGTYQTVSGGWGLFGGGVLLQNSHYAKITNNVMLNVRTGVQTGNFQVANPTAFIQTIANNQIQARKTGIVYNLHNYSPWLVENNAITGLNSTDEQAIANNTWYGLRILSLGNAMGTSQFIGNSINGSAVTFIPSVGATVWNVKDDSPASISGGSISGVTRGVQLDNYEGFNSNASNGAHATVTGPMTITPNAGGIGIRLLDSPSSTTHAKVNATVSGVTISGGAEGIKLEQTTLAGAAVGGSFTNNTITAAAAGINVTSAALSGTNPLTITGNNVTVTNQVVGGTTPTVGISLTNVTSLTTAATVGNNTITGPLYGYVVFNLDTDPVTSISGGTATITGVMQGISIFNTLTGTAPFFKSKINLDGVSMSAFNGNLTSLITPLPAGPLKDFLTAINFHAGIYTFTGGSTLPLEGITLNASGVTIDGTQTVTQSSGGIYLADFSGGPNNVQTVTINESNIINNTNRGLDVRGKVNATVTNSTFTNNGGAAPGTGGNNGFTIIAQQGATVNAMNNFITHPATSTSTVTAFLTGNGLPSTIIAHDNSVLMNGNVVNGRRAVNIAGSTINATCNWWGVSCAANVAALMSGVVTYDPFLGIGTDVGGVPTDGFQPAPGACTGAVIAAIAGVTTLCEPGHISVLTGSASGGYGTKSYSWSSATPANVSLSPTNLAVTTATSVAQGTSILTLTVTDQNGCTDTQTVVFTVTNPAEPTYTIGNSGAQITGNYCGTTLNLTTDPTTCGVTKTVLKPVWSDNCSGVTPMITVSAGVTYVDNGAFIEVFFPKGRGNTVTFKGTDASNNMTTCVLTVNVADDDAPVFSNVPANITINVPLDNCSQVITWTPPTVIENCPGVTVTSNYSPGAVISAVPGVSTQVITVTYTATDAMGLMTSVSFNITLNFNCIPLVELTMQMPPFAPPSTGMPNGGMVDGVFTVNNISANATHELTPQGNVKVLVALPSGSIFTSSFNPSATADNGDWIMTPYPSMMLFTLKPGVSIPAAGTKTITVKYTGIGTTGQTGRTTGSLITGSGGDVNKSNNSTLGNFSIN